MYVAEIIWLPDVLDKLDWKHGVSPAEVENILFGRPMRRKVQRGHVPGEDVFAAFGRTDAGRHLVVFFVYKQSREALIISAREMDGRERRLYERR
ncbi:MAG: BrnT family toxin [Geobacter sp.]|nr:MAG: BrnT family toxin [Geobacter sp.]